MNRNADTATLQGYKKKYNTTPPCNTFAVISWLDSLRFCSLQIVKARNRIQGIEETAESISSSSLITVTNTTNRADKIGQLIERREEQLQEAREEVELLEPTVKQCADFIAKAARASDTPKPFQYLLKYYAEAASQGEAAAAVGVDIWTAKAYPRILAPELYQLDPRRFSAASKSWGRYGYWEFSTTTPPCN